MQAKVQIKVLLLLEPDDVGGDKTVITSDSGASGGAGSPSYSNTMFTEDKSKMHPKTAELLANRHAH